MMLIVLVNRILHLTNILIQRITERSINTRSFAYLTCIAFIKLREPTQGLLIMRIRTGSVRLCILEGLAGTVLQ
ncbi:Uncharacterised protein [Legionella pneumophila]|nr:Uncharacterised protein [Legionella pneumophila]